MKKIATFLTSIFTFFTFTLPVFAATSADIFGEIEAPVGVEAYNAKSPSGIGLILFFSNIIKAATVIAGIWAMINFIIAGWIYITSAGDSGAHQKVSDKMTMSLIGLMIIVGAYTIAALIGMIIFGDPTFIINPRFQGV